MNFSLPSRTPHARGHRHVGGILASRPRERHYGTEAIYIAMAAAVVAASVSAYASYEGGQTAQANARYNAKVATDRATYEQQLAQYNADQQAKRDRVLRSAMLANAAASGVDTSEGSPLLVEVEAAKEAALNYEAIRSGGAARASGLLAEAEIQRYRGDRAAQAGYLGAGASLLSGISTAAGYSVKSRAGSEAV